MLQMMAAYCQPMEVSEEALAVNAIREVGPAGHFFGISHTIDRYENAFYAPMLSNWDNFDRWVERGSVSAAARANRIWKDLLEAYERPPIDPAVDEHLRDYVWIRKRELGGTPA
jgi:trimethylamine--corrinoid protein Co-methyltransferase